MNRTGMLIGRGSDCDWVLPDADRILSNRHCRITWVDGHYLLTDSSKNGVFHNHAAAPVGREHSVVLEDGDVLGLGDYEILVEIGRAPDPGSGGLGSGGPDFGGTGEPWRGNGLPPLEPPRTPGPAIGSAHDHVPLDRVSVMAPLPIAATRELSPPQPAPRPPSPPAPDLATETLRLGSAWFLDDDLYDVPPSAPAPSPAPCPMPFPTVEPGRGPVVAAPMTWEPPPASPSAVEMPATPSPPAAPRPAEGREEAGDRAGLLEVFLAAAGLPAEEWSGIDPADVMRLAGATHRAMAEGLHAVLAMRGCFKRELRIDGTMLAEKGNNPLKFAADAEEAVAVLLYPPLPGFLPAAEAVREVLRDIQQHEYATSAGMQEAVSVLIRRFDPDELKGRLDRQSLLATVVPSLRRARYWELYETSYRQLADEAETDFQDVFTQALAEAYRRQIRALTQGEPAPSSGTADPQGE